MATLNRCCPHGEAALAIIHSLLLEAVSGGALRPDLLEDLLEDAASSFEQLAADASAGTGPHREAAWIIRRMAQDVTTGPGPERKEP